MNLTKTKLELGTVQPQLVLFEDDPSINYSKLKNDLQANFFTTKIPIFISSDLRCYMLETINVCIITLAIQNISISILEYYHVCTRV